MLAPFTQIRAATTVAMDGTLSHRVRLEGPRDEFRDLADSFDVMLERLEAHVAEQRRLAANASHELRTPLAISQTLLEVARNEPDLDVNHLIDRLHAVNVRAIDLIQALLILSRADQRSFTSEPVDSSLLLDEAIETLVPLAEKRRVRLLCDGGATPAVGSRALLLQVTINPLNNAISHNLSDGGTVWVSTETGNGSVELVVENTGEVLGPELVSTLASRSSVARNGCARIRPASALG
ncbi:sensor histidine kinase [Arthrobacter gengyunqii]|uniref:sensor histidine kinase n=1 Tax=Arthrobacter gengyunqii TaxID=2886940 RepID=UPI0022B10862|nr:HAMP domain-containing sensor histidine kinase [Arthrobacter gengyunqii]